MRKKNKKEEIRRNKKLGSLARVTDAHISYGFVEIFCEVFQLIEKLINVKENYTLCAKILSLTCKEAIYGPT